MPENENTDLLTATDAIDTELVNSAKEFKSTPVRFIIIASIAIIGTLVGVIVYLNNNTNNVTQEKYDAMVNDRNDWKTKAEKKDSIIAVQQNERYDFILKLYEADQQKKAINAKIDSITIQVDKANNTLK